MSSTKFKRSRNGCINCKQLKRKCDEVKPNCGYCTHTNRNCQYFTSLIDPPNKLTNTLKLNQTTTFLNISKFELRLLKYFNQECIDVLTFGNNLKIYNCWKIHVPSIFSSSKFVRHSIYAFASLCLTSKLKLDPALSYLTEQEKLSLIGADETVIEENKNKMFELMTKYFQSTIVNTNVKLNNDASTVDRKCPTISNYNLACELTIANILIYAFLGIHTHSLVPLLSFDFEFDLIRISQGIGCALSSCGTIIMNSDLKALLFYDANHSIKKPTKLFPILLNFQIDDSSQIVREGIQLLNLSIYEMANYNYSVLLYRWLMLLPQSFSDLLHQKDSNALRVLYIWCGLSLICKFKIFHKPGPLSNFMKWYKKENYCNDSDDKLYHITNAKYLTWNQKDFTHFGSLNIEKSYTLGTLIMDY